MAQLIYLTDDEQSVRDVLSAFLTQAGFTVECFASGDTLLAACKSLLPDLVVLDIMMPGTDGLSVWYALRCAARTRSFRSS